MKIVSTGKTLSTTEYYRKKIRARRKRWLAFGLVVILFLVILVFLSRLEYFQIKEVKIVGAQVVSTETVQDVIRDVISGKYLWFVPKSNAIIFPEGLVESILLRKFPRLSSIDLSLEGLERLVASVVEREPFALYCEALAPSEVEGCYFLDESGFIFDEAPIFSEGVYLVYSYETPLTDPLGREFLPREVFKGLEAFINSFSSLGFEPVAVVVGERDLAVSTSRGAKLLIRRGGNLGLTLSNLEAFLKDESIQAQADFLERVTELDLRTENKVFYKFK